MRAIKLWLEQDKDFPRFQRLAYEITEVPLADVLLNGIHPWNYGSSLNALASKFAQMLNSQENYLPELKEFGYGSEFSFDSGRGFYREGTTFERLLSEIREDLYFVEDLSYLELIDLAKKSLTENWTNQTVYNLLTKVCLDFNSIRDFLRKKNKDIKLSGYDDLKRYDLSGVLKLSDFETEDKVLINEALPVTNFRTAKFLKQVTDSRGLLRLASSLDQFQIRKNLTYADGDDPAILYRCQREGDNIRFHPVMNYDPSMRKLAKKIAVSWRQDKGRYCFTTDIQTTEKMNDEGNFQILFPELDYSSKNSDGYSTASLAEQFIPRYIIGRIIKAESPGEVIKDVLRKHGVSMTGRKEELVEKLAKVSAKVYQEKLPELDDYFTNNRFLKVEGNGTKEARYFPVIDDCDLKNMLLTMHAIKHLRGSTILDAAHCNDTFDLVSLAKALINREVVVSGSFVRIIDNQNN